LLAPDVYFLPVKQNNHGQWLWPVLWLGLAFALRLHALDARPLWWDEGLTLTFAFLPPAENAAFARLTADVNPPLYRWLVGGLTSLVGVTVFTTRLVTVYASLIVVAAVYGLVNRLLGRATAVITTLLLAISPFHIYYAQEAKGYALTAAAVLVSVVCWWEIIVKQQVTANNQPATTHDHHRGFVAWRGQRSFWLLAGILSLLLALGSNYLAIFAVVTQNFLSLLLTGYGWWRGATWRPLLRPWAAWLTIQIGAGLLLLPYALATFGTTRSGLAQTSNSEQTLALAVYWQRVLNTFSAGEPVGGWTGLPLTLLILPLAAVGLAAGLRRQKQGVYAATAVWLLLPPALGFLFQLRFPWFYARFLLFAQPVLFIWVAAALIFLAQRLRPLIAGALLLVILLLHLPLLPAHYNAPARLAEDLVWPELFAAIRPSIQPGDGLIARYPWMPGYMRAYLPPATQPEWVLGFFDVQTIGDELQGLLDQHGRIWQIDYQMPPWSPDNDSAQWLRGRAALAYWQTFEPGSVALFVQPAGQPAPGLVAAFNNGVEVSWTPFNGRSQPGQAVAMWLTWSTRRPLDSHLVRFLHLVASDGRLAAQVDEEPGQGLAVSYEWPVGVALADPAAILLPADLAPGHYELWLGLYDRYTLARILLRNGDDHLVVGRIEVP
jgi:mannosyltransferase